MNGRTLVLGFFCAVCALVALMFGWSGRDIPALGFAASALVFGYMVRGGD
jgi:hypothetical protein